MHALKLKTHFWKLQKTEIANKKKFMQLCRVERILVAFSGDHFLRFFSYFLHFWRKTDNHPKSLRKPRGKFEKQKFWNFFLKIFLRTDIEILFRWDLPTIYKLTLCCLAHLYIDCEDLLCLAKFGRSILTSYGVYAQFP